MGSPSSKSYEELIKSVSMRMSNIKYKVLVISGKGGVGKSFITSSLALLTASTGRSVGILDADIHGPSIPKFLGISNPSLSVGSNGVEPVVGPLGVKVISVQFFLPEEDLPIIWRGPLKGRLISEFLSQVNWGSLNYLFIDLPPGTGDEVLSVVQYIKDVTGAVVVTIPSQPSKLVVKKAVRFCQELNVPVLGVVENMKEFVCPSTGTVYQVFPGSAGREIAKELGLKYLGSIPLDPRVSECVDLGIPYVIKYPDTPVSKVLKEVVDELVKSVEGIS